MGKYLDFLNKKLYWILLAITLVVYCYTIFFTYLHNIKSEGYILGDWLINYQDGGFKRRGLSGSFFFLLQDITGIPLHILVYTFQFILISFFFYTYYLIVKDKRITIYYLSLVLSSIGFVGLLNSVDYVGKKEFILFAIFAYYVYLADKKKLTPPKELFISILLIVGMLFHEIILFFIPYFLIVKYYFDGEKFRWKTYIQYLIAVFVPAFLIVFFGKNINEGQSLSILKERGVIFTKGIFFWDKVDEKAVLVHRLNHLFVYTIGFFLSGFHIWFYLSRTFQSYKRIGIMLLGAMLYSLPLFYVGLDWGRWLYIHMVMVIILMGFFLKNNKMDYIKISKSNYLITILIIVFSLVYRVELSGLFTFQGFFYRVFIAPVELLNKML